MFTNHLYFVKHFYFSLFCFVHLKCDFRFCLYAACGFNLPYSYNFNYKLLIIIGLTTICWFVLLLLKSGLIFVPRHLPREILCSPSDSVSSCFFFFFELLFSLVNRLFAVAPYSSSYLFFSKESSSFW